MDIETLKALIIEQREQCTLPENFVDRVSYPQINDYIKNKEIVIITGIRRCGKSTLLQKIRHDSAEFDYYFNFEDERLMDFTVHDFQHLLTTFVELFGEQKTLYFDEIQNIPDWERFIRRVYDQGYKIYITGSNAAMLSVELGTKLTGRYIPIEIYPLSFYEYLYHVAPTLTQCKKVLSTIEKGLIKKHFNDYCRTGGFPEFTQFEEPKYLQTLYTGIIYKDIITRYKLTREKPIKSLAHYVASNIGKEVAFNALSKLIDVRNATTVSDYFTYLENSFLCFLIHRYDHSIKKQAFYNKKQYFVDHALANVIGFRISEEKGRLLENIVFIELKRRFDTVFFHKKEKECDFIIQENNKITLVIQVCSYFSSDTAKQREYNGLLEAMQTYNLKEGLIIGNMDAKKDVVTLNETQYHIHIVPIWQWLLL